MSMRVAVVHMGARRYYTLPRLFYERSALASFHTEFYVKTDWGKRILERMEKAGISRATDLKGRYHPGLDGAPIADYKFFGMWYRWRQRRVVSRERPLLNQAAFRSFGRKIMLKGLKDPDVVYAFPGEALDVYKALGSEVTRFLDQNSAGYRTFSEVTKEEEERWPGWEIAKHSPEREYPLIEREESEWVLADGIIVPSDFVAQCLRARRVPDSKIDVVPYPADLTTYTPRRRRSHQGPLRVLFLGKVNLMKGIPYLLDAVARLGSSAVTVRLAGDVELSREKLAPYEKRGAVHFLGRIPRSSVADQLDWADILCMPSLCEGQSLATTEALASGLPVICTPNTGSRVREGIDGTVISPRDITSLAAAIEVYVKDRELLRWQSEQAVADRDRLGFTAYGDALFDVVRRRFDEKNSGK